MSSVLRLVLMATIAAWSISNAAEVPSRAPATPDQIEAIEPVKSWMGHAQDQECFVLGFTPDNKLLVTAGRDRFIRVWNVASWKLEKEISCEFVAKAFVRGALSPDGKKVAVIGYNGGLIHEREKWISAAVIDLQTGKACFPQFNGHYRYALSASFSPDGKYLATGGEGADPVTKAKGTNIIVRNAATGQVIWDKEIAGQASFEAIDYTPNGKMLLAYDGTWMSRVFCLDALTGKIIREWQVKLTSQGRGLAVSPDGRTLLTATAWDDIALRRYDLREGRPTGEIRFHSAVDWSQVKLRFYPSKVTYFPGGWFFAAGGGKGIGAVWEAVTGLPVARLAGVPEAGSFTSLAISPDERFIASSDNRGRILIWDFENWRNRLTFSAGAESGDFWEALGHFDPRIAQFAVRALSTKKGSIALLEEHLRTLRRESSERIDTLIRELNDRDFNVRMAAEKELMRLGKWIEPQIKSRLVDSLSLQQRRSLEGVWSKTAGRFWNPQEARYLRVIQILTEINSDESRTTLQKLAQSGVDDFVTDAAHQSLMRSRQLRNP